MHLCAASGSLNIQQDGALAADVGDFFKIVFDSVRQFGWAKGTLTVFFWVAHWFYYRAMQGRLKDRQDEIDRLAADNHAYRDRWLAIHDKQHNFVPPAQQPRLPKKDNDQGGG